MNKNPDNCTAVLQMLHGGGQELFSGNRWFDKSMQLIVSYNGVCGLCYEHSASEGIAVVQLIEHLVHYLGEKENYHLARIPSYQLDFHPIKLNWKTNSYLSETLKTAQIRFQKDIDNLELDVFDYIEYGKNDIKENKLSPDATIQLSLQLAYYRIYAKLVSTYESASIRRFKFGRVDNIRACTQEALHWVESVIANEKNGNKNIKLEKDLFILAIKRQSSILLQTILGQGIDNHLLGLECIASMLNKKIPNLFSDNSYIIANHFILSTSQVIFS
ncbi:hypothetical protein A3Q56_08215 [Intoshia linei]|uniref:Choline O-acetyltransferase n=1 Tax=Intoshia linei TaxID=1819745 RepID=A0A177AQJ8_9BILA|nr:hypothetical protein A3Q56_08215 [Intoshia linei]